MSDKDQKVFVMNTVSVEAGLPLPVTLAQPVSVTGTISAQLVPQSRAYDYQVFTSSDNYDGYVRQGGGQSHFQILKRWLNEGWEISYEGRPRVFAIGGPWGLQPSPNEEVILVLRRPR
jgi:hypothetical protein